MNDINPLLEKNALPAFSQIRPQHVVPAVLEVLANYREGIEELLQSSARDFASVMLTQERLDDRLNQVWAPVSHLHGVQDSPALREVYSVAQEKITEFAAKLGQNKELYNAVEAVANSSEYASLECRTEINR